MIFHATKLSGVYVIEPERHADERGFFARTWCQREFADHGLNPHLAQCSLSYNRQRGTLRGLHYQAPPHAEAKLVRATRGAIYDVVVDLRPDSPTQGQWLGVELTSQSGRSLYIPDSCAHGFQTLTDECEVCYQISEFHHPESALGVRWNDPQLAIDWPLPVTVISDRDAHLPLLVPGTPALRVGARAFYGSTQVSL